MWHVFGQGLPNFLIYGFSLVFVDLLLYKFIPVSFEKTLLLVTLFGIFLYDYQTDVYLIF